MARSTSSPATLGAALSDISTAAQAQGWTEEQRYTEGDNSYDTLVLSRSSYYYYIATDESDFFLTHSPSYTASTGWDSISGRPTNDCKCIGTAPPLTTLEIFATADNIHVAVEFDADRYRHFSFGVIEKIDDGSWTGGEYVVGTDLTSGSSRDFEDSRQSFMWDGSVATISGITQGTVRAVGLGGGDNFHLFGDQDASNGWAYGTCRNGLGNTLRKNGPNAFNNRARLIPIQIYISDNGAASPTAGWIPLGYVKGARVINNELLTSKQADPDNTDWIVFPCLEKSTSLGVNSTDDYPDSYNHGIAYKV